MKLVLAFVLAWMLSGCSSVAPSQLYQDRWKWPSTGAPSMQLEQVLTSLDSPRAIARHLQANYTFSTDYDFTEFLSPNTFIQTRKGCCTAYARFWLEALGKLGMPGRFVVMFGPQDSHAVAIFQDRQGAWRMTSNDRYYDKLDLDPAHEGERAAAMRAAQEFYGAGWKSLVVMNDQGRVLQTVANPGPAAMMAVR